MQMRVAGLSNQNTPSNDWNLGRWLQYQEQLHPRAIELGLERVGGVARRLGVLDAVPTTLTIGGTNGKGSSATLAALICREAGHRVGLYTSPHLMHYNERISVDGRDADDAALCAAFAAVEAARGETPLTYFEFGTLAALLLFRQAGVTVQVLEVGLGGRLDAVNLIAADAALVTSIGLDHLDWLGNSRESIGREKAGIFRAGRPAVCSDPDPPRSLGAANRQLGRDFSYEDAQPQWHWRGVARRYHQLPRPGLPGAFQLQNAAGVLALLEALPGLGIGEEQIRAALPRLKLPGRFQRVGKVILDVAHNAEAAAALAHNLRAAGLGENIAVVLGMLSDKPVEEVGRVLAGFCREVWLGGLPAPRGLSAEQLAARLAGSDLKLHLHADVPAAFAAAGAGARGDIVVTGSFLTVASVTELLNPHG